MLAPLATDDDFDLECQYGLLGDRTEKEKAISAIVKEYKKPLMQFLVQSFDFIQEADAADAVQQTFIDIWNKANGGNFNPTGSLRSLLFTIAKRRAMDIVRKRSRYLYGDDEVAEAIGNTIAGTVVGEAWKKAQRLQLSSEIQAEFKAFVRTLPSKQKKVAAILADFVPDWLSDQEISDEILRRTDEKVPIVEIKGAKQTMMKKFRSLLKGKGLL